MTAARRYSEEGVGWILCTTARVSFSKRRQVSEEMDEASGCAGEYSSMSSMGVDPNTHSNKTTSPKVSSNLGKRS
jgi:hypothetical protein